jgi:hypothetical protein
MNDRTVVITYNEVPGITRQSHFKVFAIVQYFWEINVLWKRNQMCIHSEQPGHIYKASS